MWSASPTNTTTTSSAPVAVEVRTIADGDLAELVDEIGRRNGYRIEAHRLELFGTCPGCAAAADAKVTGA